MGWSKDPGPTYLAGRLPAVFYFMLGCDIKYESFVYRKSEYENIFRLEARMARDLSQFIRDNLTYFQRFNKVILYRE